MMVLSALRPDASLLEFLAARARSATWRRLTVDVLIGAAILAAAVRWDSSARLVGVSAALMLIAYGVWGLFEHARVGLEPRGWRRTASVLRTAGTGVAVAGVLAAIGVLLGVWGLALGTWIS